jgi:hypothetical protein
MSKKTRRRLDAQLKAKVALEALRYKTPHHRDCFVSLAMMRKPCHYEERSGGPETRDHRSAFVR